MIELYAHQIDMVNRCRATGKRSVLLQAPTGVGKSIIASHIIQSALSKGTRTIFTVPRLELIDQMGKNYRDFGIEYSVIASREKYFPQIKNTIASVNSLASRIGKIEPPQLLIVDETHYGAEALDKIIKWGRANNAFILGLSATPWKANGKGLKCWYDTMVRGPSVKWLIDNNFLSQYRAFAPDNIDMTGVRVTAGDYNKQDLSGRMESDRKLVGSVVDHYIKYAMGMRGITFTVSRAHSAIVCEAYRASGVPAATIDGETPKDERRRLAVALARGEIFQLVNAELLTFGYDLAAAANMPVTIQCMSDLQPTLSIAKQKQKDGRFMRYEGPDAKPHIKFDHANNIKEHGFPDDETEWTLEDEERRGKSKGEKEKVIPYKICSECHFAHKPSPHCPECGFVYPIEARTIDEVDGDLVEIERDEAKRKSRMEVGREKTFEGLVAIAKERGYKMGWVYKQCAIKGININ